MLLPSYVQPGAFQRVMPLREAIRPVFFSEGCRTFPFRNTPLTYCRAQKPLVSTGVAGSEGTQQLVEAGAACVAARSFLSAAARHLLDQLPTQSSSPRSPTNGATAGTTSTTTSNNGNGRGSSAETEDYGARDGGGVENERLPGVASATAAEVAAAAGTGGPAALLSDLVWRYLELGARGRVCVAALRRSAREMAGNSGAGGGGRGGFPEGGGGSAAALGEEERAAARLEEGLSAGERGHVVGGGGLGGRAGFGVHVMKAAAVHVWSHVGESLARQSGICGIAFAGIARGGSVSRRGLPSATTGADS